MSVVSHLKPVKQCYNQDLFYFYHQLCNEFKRITSVDLLETFRASIDQHTPQLLKLYRARKGAFGTEMEDLLNKLDQQVTC